MDLGHSHVKSVIAYHHDANLGFSAGVNQIVLAAPQAPYWLVASNDIKFRPGALAEISRSMADRSDEHSTSCVWGLTGDPVSQYAGFVLTPHAIKTVGYFDENFWPAYGEDCDYTLRLARSGCPIFMETNPMRLASHVGSASWTTTAGKSNMAQKVHRIGATFNNFDYLGSKWGINVCNLRIRTQPYITLKGFETPFNAGNKTLASWKLDIPRRLKIKGPDKCLICDSSNVYPTSAEPMLIPQGIRSTVPKVGYSMKATTDTIPVLGCMIVNRPALLTSLLRSIDHPVDLFRPGALAEISRSMADRSDEHSTSCVWGLTGDPVSQYAGFVLTPHAIKTVGYFDENFWPAYGEDCDYTLRLARSGCPIFMETNPMRLASHVGSASWSKKSNERWRETDLESHVLRTDKTFGNIDYLTAKWGLDACRLKKRTRPYIELAGYPTPFNDSTAKLSAWALDLARRETIARHAECLICDSKHIPNITALG